MILLLCLTPICIYLSRFWFAYIAAAGAFNAHGYGTASRMLILVAQFGHPFDNGKDSSGWINDGAVGYV